MPEDLCSVREPLIIALEGYNRRWLERLRHKTLPYHMDY